MSVRITNNSKHKKYFDFLGIANSDNLEAILSQGEGWFEYIDTFNKFNARFNSVSINSNKSKIILNGKLSQLIQDSNLNSIKELSFIFIDENNDLYNVNCYLK